jgi:putative hydrolase of the HAD superfamily
MKRDAIVFDGDDTLWFVEPLYDDARSKAAAIVAGAGIDAGQWERLQRRIDVRYVSQLGVSSKRFPASCVEAYRRLARRSAHGVDQSVEVRVREAACSVFARTASPASGVSNVLELLRGYFRMALLTKGEEEVQRKRIADAGLTNVFDHVSIVPDKGVREFSEVLAALGADASSAWSVGNSLASDINPALRLGMRAIWINAPVWEYERRESKIGEGYVVSAPDLSTAARIILKNSAGTQYARC